MNGPFDSVSLVFVINIIQVWFISGTTPRKALIIGKYYE